MRPSSNQSLYHQTGERKYLTPKERKRFLDHTYNLPPAEGCFCRLLLFTGLRISEALSLSGASLDPDNRLVAVKSLKKRGAVVIRTIPIPSQHMQELINLAKGSQHPLWIWGRTKAWTVVSLAMCEAGICGIAATPRGLRHTFGTHAVMSGVPITLLQRWMGHTKLETTAIYTNLIGIEERKIAARMW